jgi:hypothetical protein
MFPASIRVWSVIRQQINTTTSQTIFVIYCRSSIQNYENKKNSPKRAGIVLTVSSQQSASGAIRRMYTVCVCVQNTAQPE